MKRILIGIGALAVIGGAYWYIKNQTALLSEICYNFVGNRIVSAGLDKVVIDITMQIKNKSKIDLTIKGYDIDLFVNGNKVGKALSSSNQVIKGNSYSNIILTIAASTSEVFKTALNLDVLQSLTGKTNNVMIGAKGVISINAGNLLTIKNVPVDISMPLSEAVASKSDEKC